MKHTVHSNKFVKKQKQGLRRIAAAVFIASTVLVSCDTFLVCFGNKNYRCPGRKVNVKIFESMLMDVHDNSRIPVPFVLSMPTNAVVLAGVRNGVAIDAYSNVYVRLKIKQASHRPIFSLVADVRWLNLSEVVGVVAPSRLMISDETMKKNIGMLQLLEQRSSSNVKYDNHYGWHHFGPHAAKIVGKILQEERETQTNKR